MNTKKYSNLTDLLKTIFQAATLKATSLEITPQITPSTKESFGHYQFNSALSLAKELKKKPREIAESIIEHLEGSQEFIAKTEVAGPGFINIYLNPALLEKDLTSILQDPRLGVPFPKQKKRSFVNFHLRILRKQCM